MESNENYEIEEGFSTFKFFPNFDLVSEKDDNQTEETTQKLFASEESRFSLKNEEDTIPSDLMLNLNKSLDRDFPDSNNVSSNFEENELEEESENEEQKFSSDSFSTLPSFISGSLPQQNQIYGKANSRMANYPLNSQFHNSMPFKQQNCFFGFNKVFQGQPQQNFRSFPNFPINCYGSLQFNQQNPMRNFSNTPNIINNYVFVVEKDSKKKGKKEKKPKKQNESDFESLENLLESLKGGKQIGNFIRSRNNTDSMVNLVKKLPSEKITELIQMIKHKLKDIMISNNKFSQKLFEQCTPEQRLLILSEIKGSFVDIAFNKWGSYSLQSLIKIVSLPEEQELIKKCIEGRVYEMAMDKQANFVLQKLILLLNEKGMTSITEEIFHIFSHLIYNSTGIGLLKNLVLTNKSSEMRKKFVQKVVENLPNIINNQIGHTLLLQMMEKWDFETCRPMISEIFKSIQKYSVMKYSSSIVLRCIEITDFKPFKSFFMNFFNKENLEHFLKTDSGIKILHEIIKKVPAKRKSEVYLILQKVIQSLIEEKINVNGIIYQDDFLDNLFK